MFLVQSVKSLEKGTDPIILLLLWVVEQSEIFNLSMVAGLGEDKLCGQISCILGEGWVLPDDSCLMNTKKWHCHNQTILWEK